MKYQERITIYAPDGTPHTVAPVDAREILASGNGYTAEPPAQVVNEQQQEQQPVASDTAPAVEAVNGLDSAASDTESDNHGDADTGKARRVTNRKTRAVK